MTEKKLPVFLTLALLLAASSGIAFFQSASEPPSNVGSGLAPDEETAWVCPMHPDYTMDISGKCPRCGMELVRAAPFDVRDYQLDFTTVPALVKPGQKATFRFKFFHPGTGEA